MGVLQELLDAREPLFSLAIRQLERASGQTGQDVRLISELAQKVRATTEALGLDAQDTTGRELHAALQARIIRDNAAIARLLGGENPDDLHDMAPRIIQAVQPLDLSRDCWVLKRSVAKKLLKSMPPKVLMKQLGYRSVDSMLKHANIDEIYVALRFSEGTKWLSGFNQLLATVRPTDLEVRERSVFVMDTVYGDLAAPFVSHRQHPVVHAKEMGIVAIAPVQKGCIKGGTLLTLAHVLHYINEVRVYSAFFKMKQVQPNFGELLVETLEADPSSVAEMAGQYVHWRVIHRYFGAVDRDVQHPEVFEPHIQPEDIRWRSVSSTLASIYPEMSFWVGLDYVGKIADNKPVSCNVVDVLLSLASGSSYAERFYGHFRASLWNELLVRYMGMENLRGQILSQLDSSGFVPGLDM